jgi:DNA-directed RNA polymerase subunit RPC12/RpoP
VGGAPVLDWIRGDLVGERWTCPVCFEEALLAQSTFVVPPCGHSLCMECTAQCLKPGSAEIRCPVCRGIVLVNPKLDAVAVFGPADGVPSLLQHKVDAVYQREARDNPHVDHTVLLLSEVPRAVPDIVAHLRSLGASNVTRGHCMDRKGQRRQAKPTVVWHVCTPDDLTAHCLAHVSMAYVLGGFGKEEENDSYGVLRINGLQCPVHTVRLAGTVEEQYPLWGSDETVKELLERCLVNDEVSSKQSATDPDAVATGSSRSTP